MKIGIIGSTGFIGSALTKRLNQKYEVFEIPKSKEYNTSVDILINANGTSKKFEANKNPIHNFDCNVSKVYESIIKYDFKQYIFISSIDAFKNSIYGINKRIAENVVKEYCPFYTIVRPGAILDKTMKKGPVYDLLNSKPLYITEESRLQLITLKELCRYIETIIENKLTGEYNLYGEDSISINTISHVLGKEIKNNFVQEKIVYNYFTNNVHRTSMDFLLDFKREIE